jgi:transcriptional regulator with XRE-family HTH domain
MSTEQMKPDFDQFTVDELDASIYAATKVDPALAAAVSDANALQSLLDELVALRRALGMTQTDVAHRMGVRQPTVSQFETESSDPRISTLQRYARAVHSRVVLNVVSFDLWGEINYADKSTAKSARPQRVSVRPKTLAGLWAAENARADFMLAA